MTAKQYLTETLRKGGTEFQWILPLTQDECSSTGNLFGGTGLAAAIRVLEFEAHRPLVWITGQFVSHAKATEELTFQVELTAVGHNSTQARVTGRVDEREVISAFATLGKRDVDKSGVWAVPIEASPPLDCPIFPSRDGVRSVSNNLERRLVKGRSKSDDPPVEDGRVAMWVRVPEGIHVDPAFLAVLGDYVPWGGRDAVGGGVGGGRSLDNTLRVVNPVPTDWILVDVRIGSLTHGYAHGTVHLWSEQRDLLATASQTCQYRPLD